MLYQPTNPVIVQSDRSILLEVDNALYTEARDALARFAELVKSPEHIHTYRITPLSLWNAAAAGLNADEIIAALVRYGKYELPSNVRIDIADYVSRYGRLKLTREGDQLCSSRKMLPCSQRSSSTSGCNSTSWSSAMRIPWSWILPSEAFSSMRWSFSATLPKTWRDTRMATPCLYNCTARPARGRGLRCATINKKRWMSSMPAGLPAAAAASLCFLAARARPSSRWARWPSYKPPRSY